MFCRLLFVLFLLAIVLSVLLRFMDSDYPFGILWPLCCLSFDLWMKKDKQQSTKHTYKTKDRVTRTPLKTGGELMCSRRISSPCSTRYVCFILLLMEESRIPGKTPPFCQFSLWQSCISTCRHDLESQKINLQNMTTVQTFKIKMSFITIFYLFQIII
jgi:hypothetical protein